MIYRATIRSAAGIYVAGAAVALLLVTAGLLSRSGNVGMLIAGIGICAWLVAIRARYSVRVSSEQLETRNLVGGARIKWGDIQGVYPAVESGDWSGRLFGPAVLEFVSSQSRLRVNFKLFPAECLQEVMRRVPPGARVRI